MKAIISFLDFSETPGEKYLKEQQPQKAEPL